MKKCKVIGCNGQHHSKGYCQKHYRQYQRGTLTEPIDTIDSLLDTLKSYESLIHQYASTVTQPKTKELFVLLESIINN